MIISIILIIVGFILLIKGADYLVIGASNIAKRFHIKEIIIGLTIVSIGTSMPELFVSITSAYHGYSDISIGNVIGSNLCNLLLILGISSMIKPIIFKNETIKYEIPLCLFFTIIFLFICNMHNKLSLIEGITLIILFLLFISYTVYISLNNIKKDNKLEKINILKNILLTILGIFLLKIGGNITIKNALIIAYNLGLSEKIIGLTIIAIGTSLPELLTSIIASFKGNSDIAIGNIIGSNIFNMLLIIGVSSLITDISFNNSYNFDLIYLITGIIILWLFAKIPPKNKLNKIKGLIYFILYIIYLIILFIVT